MSLRSTERHGKTMSVLHTHKHADTQTHCNHWPILTDPSTYEKDHHGGHLNWHTHTHPAVWGLSRTTHFMSLCCCLRQSCPQVEWTGDSSVPSLSVLRLVLDARRSFRIWDWWLRHSFNLSSVRVRRSSSTETVCMRWSGGGGKAW